MKKEDIIKETLKKIATLFNENNIQYALTGGIVSELRSGIIREHKDIDFAIKKGDIIKIEQLLEVEGIYCRDKIIELKENDSWTDTTEHNRTAIDANNGCNIGFFVYDTQKDIYGEDGDLISKEGFFREYNIKYKGSKVLIRERMDEEIENYMFSDDTCEYLEGVKINTQPLPYVMMLKARNIRGKDRNDLVNTVSLLSDKEIDEYNKYKNNIVNIKYTAQLGEDALEGDINEVKKIIDLLDRDR